MLHDIQQQVINIVCLLFAAEQVVYCGVLEVFFAGKKKNTSACCSQKTPQ